MRDEEQLRKALRYVESNPVKAKLVAEARKWPWGSARFRDEMGALRAEPERRHSAGLNRTNEGDPAK
jgi:hypothetical protein